MGGRNATVEAVGIDGNTAGGFVVTDVPDGTQAAKRPRTTDVRASHEKSGAVGHGTRRHQQQGDVTVGQMRADSQSRYWVGDSFYCGEKLLWSNGEQKGRGSTRRLPTFPLASLYKRR